VTVTAVGTAFDVRSETGMRSLPFRRDRQRCRYWQRHAAARRLAGQRRLPGGVRHGVPGSPPIGNRCAHAFDWRDGRLQYFDERLDAIIADVNRYSERPIKCRSGDWAPQVHGNDLHRIDRRLAVCDSNHIRDPCRRDQRQSRAPDRNDTDLRSAFAFNNVRRGARPIFHPRLPVRRGRFPILRRGTTYIV